jgi:hypothetical protein
MAAASPAMAEDGKIFSIVGEIAPKWATDTPWDYDDITDSTSVSLTLSAEPKLASWLSVELSAGPKATLDDDHDSSRDSAIGASAELKFGTGVAKPFVSGSFDKKFTNFFEDGDGNERTLSGGLDFGKKIKRSSPAKKVPELSGRIELGVTDGTDDSADQRFGQVKAAFKIPMWDFGKFDIEAKAARRGFAHADATAGYKERRTELGGSIGFDFARGVIRLLGGNPDADNQWLRKVKAGYNFLHRNSNIAANDKNSSSPSLALAVGQNF